MKHPFEAAKDRPTLFITADYELFLGKISGTPKACLFEPTDHLVSVVENYGKQLILFVDVMYLWRLERQAHSDTNAALTLTQVRNHLTSLLKRGHSLQLHLHTHWLDAVYDRGVWNFEDLSRYSLASLSPSPDPADWTSVLGCITMGKRLLLDLAREQDPAYEITCFRAGGLVIQPFDVIRGALAKNDLWIDSSVAPGLQSNLPGRSYDYSHVNSKDSWHFEETPDQENPKGRFLEMPVSTYWANPLNKVSTAVDRLRSPSQTRVWGDGIGLTAQPKPFHEKIRGNRALLTYDFSDKSTLINELESHISKGYKVLTLLGHPKYLSAYGLDQLKELLAEGQSRGWS